MKVKMKNVPSYASASAVYEKLRKDSKPELSNVSFDSAKGQVILEGKLSSYILSVENGNVYLSAKTKPVSYLLYVTIIGIVVVLVISASDSKITKAAFDSLCNK